MTEPHELWHPEKLAIMLEDHLPLDHHRVDLKMELTVMSVGDDGQRWLDDHAPGWEKHVGLMAFKVERAVDADQLERMRIEILNIFRGEMIRELSRKMVDQMEPGMRLVDDG